MKVCSSLLGPTSHLPPCYSRRCLGSRYLLLGINGVWVFSGEGPAVVPGWKHGALTTLLDSVSESSGSIVHMINLLEVACCASLVFLLFLHFCFFLHKRENCSPVAEWVHPLLHQDGATLEDGLNLSDRAEEIRWFWDLPHLLFSLVTAAEKAFSNQTLMLIPWGRWFLKHWCWGHQDLLLLLSFPV